MLYLQRHCSLYTQYVIVTIYSSDTGLTPMISLLNIRYHQHSKKQSTLLIFANKREEDILWREKLEEICSTDPQWVVCRWDYGLHVRLVTSTYVHTLHCWETPMTNAVVCACISSFQEISSVEHSLITVIKLEWC